MQRSGRAVGPHPCAAFAAEVAAAPLGSFAALLFTWVTASLRDSEPVDPSARGEHPGALGPLNRRLARLRQRLPEPLRPWLPAIPPPTPRNLWLLLAGLVALQNCSVFHTAQMDRFTLLAVVLWGGGLICIEDQLEQLRPQPGWFGLLLGTPLLLWVLARTAAIVSVDNLLFVLAPLAGLALTLLCLPLRQIGRFRDPLLCLGLLPVFRILGALLPEQPLSLFSAQIVGVWLSILGLDVLVDGRSVILPGGAVEVGNSCNGYEIISQLICISVVFLLAFPVRSWLSRSTLLLAAPLIALLSNTIRIALLALFSAMGPGAGQSLFRFFHDDAGSLIFAGVAVFVYGLLYMHLLERELAPLPAGGEEE